MNDLVQELFTFFHFRHLAFCSSRFVTVSTKVLKTPIKMAKLLDKDVIAYLEGLEDSDDEEWVLSEDDSASDSDFPESLSEQPTSSSNGASRCV